MEFLKQIVIVIVEVVIVGYHAVTDVKFSISSE